MRGIMGIIFAALFTASASASTSISDLLLATAYVYNPPSFDICSNDATACTEMERHDEFILVHAKGGETCPAGYYFVLNSKAHEILPVETATCDPTLRAAFGYDKATRERMLVIEQHGKISGSISLDQ